MQEVPLSRALVAEAIGTFALVFAAAPGLGASLGGLAYVFVCGEHMTAA